MLALDTTFTALADPTRRAILARLSQGEASVSELSGPFPISLPAFLKHVTTLEEAGLVRTRKEGRVRRCRLEASPLRGAASWIDGYREFWEARLDGLARYLAEDEDKEPQAWPTRISPPASPSAPPGPSRRHGSASSAPGRRRRR